MSASPAAPLSEPDWFSSHFTQTELEIPEPEESDLPELEPDRSDQTGELVGTRLRNIRTAPRFTAEDEVAAAQRIERGGADGRRAREEFIEANLGLVYFVARRYNNSPGIPFLDLIQEGNVGLLKAVDKFDWRRGCRFASIAVYCIRGEILRAIAEHGRTIRLPAQVFWSIGRIKAARRKLAQEIGCEPTPERIAERMGIPAARVTEILTAARESVPLDAPIGDDGMTIEDCIEDKRAAAPSDLADESILKKQIYSALETLTAREEKIIRMRFGLQEDGREHTLEEVGARFDFSKERARQVEAKALDKLRRAILEPKMPEPPFFRRLDDPPDEPRE